MAKILIVEDSPPNLKLIVLLLENAGHEVLHANDAQTGINLARIYQPVLILMDIQLPDMDGLAATQVLKSDPVMRNCKVYAMTAFTMERGEGKILAAGCDGYIAKPFRHHELIATIDAALEGEHR